MKIFLTEWQVRNWIERRGYRLVHKSRASTMDSLHRTARGYLNQALALETERDELRDKLMLREAEVERLRRALSDAYRERERRLRGR